MHISPVCSARRLAQCRGKVAQGMHAACRYRSTVVAPPAASGVITYRLRKPGQASGHARSLGLVSGEGSTVGTSAVDGSNTPDSDRSRLDSTGGQASTSHPGNGTGAAPPPATANVAFPPSTTGADLAHPGAQGPPVLTADALGQPSPPGGAPRQQYSGTRSGRYGSPATSDVEKVVMPPLAPPSRLRLPNLSAPITWTLMLSYLLVMLLVPISALLYKAAKIPLSVFLERAFEPVAMHAYEVTFTMAAAAAAINSVFGFLLAWVLVKYKFPGKKWIDAAVDLPFALPTSVAGLTLSTVYSDEALLGRLLAQMGIRVVFTKLGVAVAMVFVSFPFVVRTMQPVLQEIEKETEEAAWTLGASQWRTFTDVVLPPLLPSLLTGTALAFSRALGEFGSIAIIASNFAFKDLIAPVLIFQALEQYDFIGATVVGTVLLLASLVIMLVVNKLQSYGNYFRK